MSLFFETIKIENSKIYNLKQHNSRLNKTIKSVFGKKTDFDLKNFITHPQNNTIYRCKVIYDTKIKNISFHPYAIKKFQNFICVKSDISYPFKSIDRSKIENLLRLNSKFDDIIIIKENLITDTSIANIAIYDGLNWFTPKHPLLKGTLRASLIEQNSLKTKDFGVKELKSSVKIAIMNAMIGFYELKDIKITY